MTCYDYDYMNFIVSLLNWAIKIKSKETDYIVIHWINYINERGKPNRGCHKAALKCFIWFFYQEWRWETLTVPRSVSTEMVYVEKRFKDL